MEKSIPAEFVTVEEIGPDERVIRITENILDQNKMILTMNAKLREAIHNLPFIFGPLPKITESEK